MNHENTYTQYILWFVYCCIVYSIIGFSWGALMGGIAEFRHFVDGRMHGDLIVRAHTHVNLLGWVEMAIFAAIYYIVPRLAQQKIYSLTLVKVHFWMHNIGLLGMVILFTLAGVFGGMSADMESAEKIVKPLLASMGLFGTLVLLANMIWAFNIYKTCASWNRSV